MKRDLLIANDSARRRGARTASGAPAEAGAVLPPMQQIREPVLVLSQVPRRRHGHAARGPRAPEAAVIDSSRFLTAHGVCPKAWAARHELLPFTHPCDECGEPLTTTLPFAQGQFRGLRAPECSCGNEQTPYCLVRERRFGDLFTGGATHEPRGRR
mgnify:CR=1 FL=1